MSSARTRLGACWSPKPAISRTGRSRKAFNTVAFSHDFMRQRAIGEHYSKRPSAFIRSSEPPSADQSLRTGEPLRERPQLQSLQSLQLRAEQRRDRPLRAGRATAGRGGEAVVGRHRSVWVFLEPLHLAAKTPVYVGWNSLDFLGFSRPNRMISMGCAEFSAEKFSWPSWGEKPGRALAVEAFREGGIGHGASLVQFPIISNHLSSDPNRPKPH